MPSGVYKHKRGYKLSDEHRRKISKKLTGRKLSDEHRKKLTKDHTGWECGQERGVINKTSRSRANKLGRYCEKLLCKLFNDVKPMPLHNPGYDFLCSRGYKVDSKARCLSYPRKANPIWMFRLADDKNHLNKTADYFACVAYDDPNYLNPVHFWLIPSNAVNKFGRRVNDLTGLGITNTPECLAYWSQYEKPIDKVIECCTSMKCDANDAIPLGTIS